MTSNPQDEVNDLLSKLQAPIDRVETLLSYLSSTLDNISLLPPIFRRFLQQPLPRGAVNIARHIPLFQRILLQIVLPTWDDAIKEKKATALVDQFFCPDAISNASPQAGELAILAYSTILSVSPLPEYAMRMLQDLSSQYSVDRLLRAVHQRKDLDRQGKERLWADCVTNLVKVPGKVANAFGADGKGINIPEGLENGSFFEGLSMRVERLIEDVSRDGNTNESVSHMAYLLGRLVNQGLFPPSPRTSRTQSSFFRATLPAIRQRLCPEADLKPYFVLWREIVASLPSTLALQSILLSLFNSLRKLGDKPLSDASADRMLVREEAMLLTSLIGKPTPENGEIWETTTSIILKRTLDQSYARIFVCWISGAAMGGEVDIAALNAFMQSVLDLWGDSEYVRHSLLSQHHYVTSLLLVSASYFDVESTLMRELAFNHSFIQGVGRYLAHQDSSVRHCGMLVAEEIARMSGKKLSFGGWDGDDSGKPWARALRELIRARDVDADVSLEAPASTSEDVEVDEVVSPDVRRAKVKEDAEEPTKARFKSQPQGYDSDDSLEGYESPPSSRSASPTPSELAEIEKDPSLNVNVKKVPKPVYLKQLGDLLRPATGGKTSSDQPHEADMLAMALNCAEELIRKKRDYGTELAENAVNLEYALLSLKDNYELEGFAAKRQGALNALVACAPRQAAPALIEEFFKNQYSVDQRYVALNALAIGARELASLPVAESRVPVEKTAFPSKTLPPSLHKKYITASGASTDIVSGLVEGISRKALEEQKGSTSSPALVREKVLRLKRTPGISEVAKLDQLKTQAAPQRTTFTAVAAEYFICPLINRFWVFLREEHNREERTAHLEGRSKYHGAGTGLILNALVLSHFLRTLSVLVNASQNAPEWLGIIAPESLELAITIGTRPMSYAEGKDEGDGDGKQPGKEASVLSGALELALVVLDGAIQVDGGRSLALENTQVLLSANEWAGRVFEQLEKGLKVEGEGGVHEVKLRSVAAGVLLKVDEITSRWGRSMLDYN